MAEQKDKVTSEEGTKNEVKSLKKGGELRGRNDERVSKECWGGEGQSGRVQ